MSYSDPMKLFKTLQKKTKESISGGSFGNRNLLKWQTGKSYSLRLLWLPSDVRETPMINQYTHGFWDEHAMSGNKNVSVVCPTSQYDYDVKGFSVCPICSKMSEYYKEFRDHGSEACKEIYDRFRRSFKGYIPVYVVNGPEEDKHKVKIIPYPITFKRYFDEKILGIKKDDEENDVVDDNIIGIDAFMYYDPKTDSVQTSAHNFIVTVDTKKVPIGKKTVDMPSYKIEFSMKKTDIDNFDGVEITPEYFKNLSKEIHFDEDFYKMSDPEKLNEFYKKHIDASSAVDESDDIDNIETEENDSEEDSVSYVNKKSVEDEVKNPTRAVLDHSEDEDDELENIIETKKKPKKESNKKKVEEEPEEEPEENTESFDIDDDDDNEDDDIDLDDLLKDI